MREDVAAVDIGRNWFTVARLTADNRGQFRLLHAGLETGSEEWDDAELARALARYWRRDRLPTRSVCLGFRARTLSIKYFDYPEMNPTELASALRLEASELLALDRSEVVVDWRLNPAGPTRGTNRSQGILVAAPRRQVEDRIRLLRSAGLYPVRMDAPSLAVSRLIGRSPDGPQPDETLAILNLGQDQADLVILSQTMIYPRTIHLETGSWEACPAELTGHLVDAVRYARYSLQRGEVRRLLVTGLIVDTEALIHHLAAHSGLEVELWNPVERLALHLRTSWRSTDALQTMPTAITSSLGLALGPGVP